MLGDFLIATALALIFLALSWSWGRATSGGKPLDQFKKGCSRSGFVFVLGMSYLMSYLMTLISDLNWNRLLVFPTSGPPTTCLDHGPQSLYEDGANEQACDQREYRVAEKRAKQWLRHATLDGPFAVANPQKALHGTK